MHLVHKIAKPIFFVFLFFFSLGGWGAWVGGFWCLDLCRWGITYGIFYGTFGSEISITIPFLFDLETRFLLLLFETNQQKNN